MDEEMKKAFIAALHMAAAAMKPDEKIISAAMALAQMVKDKGRPVIFDMYMYAEIVDGIGRKPVLHSTDSILQHLDNMPKVKGIQLIDKEITDQDITDLKRMEDSGREYNKRMSKFVAELADAFNYRPVCKILTCSLIEMGHSAVYKPAFDDDCYVYVVVPSPTLEQCEVLDL